MTSAIRLISRTYFISLRCIRRFATQKRDGNSKSNLKVSPKSLLDDAVTESNTPPSSPEDVWTKDPYPECADVRQSQARYSFRPKVDPRETSIVLFPGQGSQYIGMAKDLLKYPNVPEMFEAASEIMNVDLLDLCLNGPKEKLDATQYQQAAVLVSSLAALERLVDEKPSAIENCVGTAGFSIGEITALTFAGALSFENAVKLVKVRGHAMQLASEAVPSGMYTVFYGPDSRLEFACSVAKELCQKKGLETFDCRIANYLFPHCKVIAGNEEALDFIVAKKDEFRLKKMKRLPVSGAFHTALMVPAAEALKMLLKKLDIEDPKIPVHSNFDGRHYQNAHHIRKQLPKQMYSSVKWEQTMHILYERKEGIPFPKTYECGPGMSLKNILKMINAKAWDSCTSISA